MEEEEQEEEEEVCFRVCFSQVPVEINVGGGRSARTRALSPEGQGERERMVEGVYETTHSVCEKIGEISHFTPGNASSGRTGPTHDGEYYGSVGVCTTAW